MVVANIQMRTLAHLRFIAKNDSRTHTHTQDACIHTYILYMHAYIHTYIMQSGLGRLGDVARQVRHPKIQIQFQFRKKYFCVV